MSLTSGSHTRRAQTCALILCTGTILLSQGLRAQNAELSLPSVPQYAPLALDTPFGVPRAPAQQASPAAAAEPGAVSYFRKLDGDDLQISSFVASRAGEDAANYRLYLGVGYKQELTSFARLTSRTFYGAGTYDGANPGEALPDEVRSSGNPSGAWLGSNWQVESTLFGRHTFFAGMEYRQQFAMPLAEATETFARIDNLSVTAPVRKLGFVTRTRLSLASGLSLNVRTRFDEGVTAASMMSPELVADTDSFEVGMERTGPRGARAQISYSWQASTDSVAGAAAPRVSQYLTKVRMEIPGLHDRLSTGLELQHLGVDGAFGAGTGREYIIGNLNVASHDLSRRTRVSVGLNNLFGAKEAMSGTRWLSFIPPDGRSVRLDLVRNL